MDAVFRLPHCAQEVSYPADMLAEHPQGGPICEGCWEDDDASYDAGDEGGSVAFSNLPRFVPQHEKDKRELVEALAALRADYISFVKYERGDLDPEKFEAIQTARAVLARVRGE